MKVNNYLESHWDMPKNIVSNTCTCFSGSNLLLTHVLHLFQIFTVNEH